MHPGDAPEQGDDEEDADFDKREAKHAADLKTFEASATAYNAAFVTRAAAAQTALEALHAKQTAAADSLKTISEAHDKARKGAVAEIEKLEDPTDSDRPLLNHKAFPTDEDGELENPDQEAQHERAGRAAELLLEHATAARENLPDSNAVADARSTLKEHARDTASAIRGLAKVTGRAPKLAVSAKAAPKARGKKAAVVEPDDEEEDDE